MDPIYLHAHNGSALRGMLYRAALALTQGHARAPDLDFIPDPALQRLLATLDESDPRGQDVPRPYVVDPPDHLPDTVRSTACRPTAKPETTLLRRADAIRPLLRWGEWTRVGNHAVKGNGLFRPRG